MSIEAKKINQIHFKSDEYLIENTSNKVSDEEMELFDISTRELSKKIGIIKLNYENEHNLSPTKAYEELEEKCQISISTFKSTISLKINPTRHFLYKLTVGLNYLVEDANKLFKLCDGELDEDCKADYICIQALKDKDNIYSFIEDFEKYTGKKIGIKNRSTDKLDK